MIKVCILDYGSGNVRSVLNAFSSFADCEVSNDVKVINNASHVILPGVGSYKNSMSLIEKRIPLLELKNEISSGKPFLGICVGMQVLGSKGIEFEEAQGLGLIHGVVSRIRCETLPLPHVGWNNLIGIREGHLTRGISEDDDFYFVHSYAFTEIEAKLVLADAYYGERFPAMVQFENIFGVQFHPEKSQKAGSKIIKNFLDIK